MLNWYQELLHQDCSDSPASKIFESSQSGDRNRGIPGPQKSTPVRMSAPPPARPVAAGSVLSLGLLLRRCLASLAGEVGAACGAAPTRVTVTVPRWGGAQLVARECQ